MYFYKGIFADISLTLAFNFPETVRFYKGWLGPAEPTKPCVSVPSAEIGHFQKQWKKANTAYKEYILSCSYACDALMRHDRMVFHGAAFLWGEKAYIFSAPSGTGKTTQLRMWNTLFGADILNGDKPILELTGDRRVFVHPSPWKGKEGLGRDDVTALLGGIILLRQDQTNTIERMSPAEAARQLFSRSYSTFNTPEEVLNTARITEGIVSAVPVWLLRNKGDEESARITRQVLSEEVGR